MSDSSGPKTAGIPAWQRAVSSDKDSSALVLDRSTVVDPSPQSTPDRTPIPESAEESKSTTLTSSSETRIDQVKRFLADDTLHNATIDQKVSFLEAKGLSKEEIDAALEQPKGEAPKPLKSQQSDYTSLSRTPAYSQSLRNESPPPPLPNRDVPPIITYPEFLMHAQKPPPIITASRLVNTAYFAAGIGAAFYGASKYLITPMTESLTDARHDFASHVQEQVEALNTKLREITSKEPPDPKSVSAIRKNLRFQDLDDAESDASSSSDPTELFHRDFGTQTSPAEEKPTSIYPPPSPSSSSSSTALEGSSDFTQAHASRLSQISNHITGLTNNDVIAASANTEISTVIRLLNEQLESLAYPAYSPANGYYGVGYGGPDKGSGKDKDDEVSKIKAEIRGVKGVLLSARNFPGSGGARRAAFPPSGTVGS